VAVLVVAAGLLSGSAADGTIRRSEVRTRAFAPPVTPAGRPGPPVPAALTTPGLDLRSGPVPIPLEIRMPTIGVDAEMLGVGILPGNVMDAPTGPAGDPVWDRAFWYRGSAIPGAASTALIAGHIDGPGGQAAVFGTIDRLVPGDPIVIRDTRSGLDLRFTVTGSENYPLERTTEPAVLNRIYGSGPVAGTWPQPSADHLAHLTLVTCSGTFRDGTHDHRLVVDAVRNP
jgi:hypothetical protein